MTTIEARDDAERHQGAGIVRPLIGRTPPAPCRSAVDQGWRRAEAVSEGIEQRRRPVLEDPPMRQKHNRGRKRSLLIKEQVECGRFWRLIDRRGGMLTEAMTMLARLSHVCHELDRSDGRQDTDHPPIKRNEQHQCAELFSMHSHDPAPHF